MTVLKIAIAAFIVCLYTGSWAQNNTLVSGEPIKSNPDKSYGRFALPSINAFAMGMAHVNEDDHPDLFLQSDRWNPGTYVYLFEKYNDHNQPVFSEGKKVKIPFEEEIQNRAVILETKSNGIVGFWGFGGSLKVAAFNKNSLSFSNVKTIEVKGLPLDFSNFGVVQLAESKYLLLFSVADTIYKRYPGRGPNVITYGSDGIWERPIPKSGIYGAFVSDLNQSEIQAKQLTSRTEALYSIEGYTLYEADNEQYILSGTRLGNIHSYKIDVENESLSNAGFIVDAEGTTQRNPAIHGALTSFNDGSNNGLIVSSEGGIYYYKSEETINENGNLVLHEPAHLLQSNADLYGSSLVVPNLTDWDGDGDLDLVSGTSLGFIHFIKNVGNNSYPKFNSPKRIKAGGYEIYVQPGYNQDIQGPGESRWGYTCPAVVDWTGNGLPDILTGDSRGKFNVYINTGTKTEPKLEPEHALYIDGMDMHGTWRVRPGVGKLGNRMAYICLDKDDIFHLYWQLDKYNLEEGKKLTIGDSINIRANFLNAGATGRSKILIVDWDEDGVKDLLVGTPRHGSIPEPVNGLPYHREEKGSAVIFLRNSGTEENPVYEYPKMLQFNSEYIMLGQHSCAPTVGKIGQGGTNNLIVGDETGRFIFYERKDLKY
jgi:hypothetical protein